MLESVQANTRDLVAVLRDRLHQGLLCYLCCVVRVRASVVDWDRACVSQLRARQDEMGES